MAFAKSAGRTIGSGALICMSDVVLSLDEMNPIVPSYPLNLVESVESGLTSVQGVLLDNNSAIMCIETGDYCKRERPLRKNKKEKQV